MREPVPVLLGALAAIVGSIAAIYYARAGLALSHYDARAHLVVARRIFDSLTPGWQQVGAVWLPLPHVLDALPVQIDAFYRSGASGTAISVLSSAVAVWAIASMVLRKTASAIAAAAGAVLFLANPNVLYLQSTPMTEPLLFATTMVAVFLTIEWLDGGAAAPPTKPGIALIAACMTRYEAWPITAAVVVISAMVLLRRNVPIGDVFRACVRLAAYPVAAIAVFLANSRWTVGAWFISSGFYVAENDAQGHLNTAWQQVREGAYHLSGDALIWSAYGATVLIGLAFLRSTRSGIDRAHRRTARGWSAAALRILSGTSVARAVQRPARGSGRGSRRRRRRPAAPQAEAVRRSDGDRPGGLRVTTFDTHCTDDRRGAA